MNILILNSILYTADNGIIPCVASIKDTMIYNMCLGFKDLGHNITLATLEDYRPTKNEEYEFAVIFFKSRYKKICKPAMLPYSSDLKEYIRKNHQKFDMIISSEAFQFQTLFASRICPEKTIIWHELALHPAKYHQIPSKIWYNIICRYFMKDVKCVIPRSEAAKLFIEKYFRQVSEQCIEHGINIEQFVFSRDKEKLFIYVGQLIPRKNIKSIILKFSKFLKKASNRFTLLVVGRGFMEQELKGLVERLEISDRVKFVGFVNHAQLNNLLKRSMAMLIDTLQDNNMVSIPESIVSGTPVLTNNIPTNSSIISDHKLGIVKRCWNENDIMDIVNNNTFYVENCIHYREKLTNKYSAQLFVDIFNNYQKNNENPIIQ